MRVANVNLHQDIKELEGKVRKTEAAHEREKASHLREVAKLNDMIKHARAATAAAHEERENTLAMLDEANEAAKKHVDMINTLRKELLEKQVCVCVYVCVCVCVYIYIYTHTHVYIAMCICLYIYIYIYIHIGKGVR
jgi:hypothetical protein